jgi:hypothetical protein
LGSEAFGSEAFGDRGMSFRRQHEFSRRELLDTTMPNPSGLNGQVPKKCEYSPLSLTLLIFLLDPPDDVLLAAFTRYSQENSGAGLDHLDQMERLKQEYQLDISSVNTLIMTEIFSP